MAEGNDKQTKTYYLWQETIDMIKDAAQELQLNDSAALRTIVREWKEYHDGELDILGALKKLAETNHA